MLVYLLFLLHYLPCSSMFSLPSSLLLSSAGSTSTRCDHSQKCVWTAAFNKSQHLAISRELACSDKLFNYPKDEVELRAQLRSTVLIQLFHLLPLLSYSLSVFLSICTQKCDRFLGLSLHVLTSLVRFYSFLIFLFLCPHVLCVFRSLVSALIHFIVHSLLKMSLFPISRSLSRSLSLSIFIFS